MRQQVQIHMSWHTIRNTIRIRSKVNAGVRTVKESRGYYESENLMDRMNLFYASTGLVNERWLFAATCNSDYV